MTPLDALDELPPHLIPAAITRLSARLLATPASDLADDYLDVGEVAALLKTSKRWIYDHATELGGIRLSHRHLVFPRRTVLTRVQRKGRRS